MAGVAVTGMLPGKGRSMHHDADIEPDQRTAVDWEALLDRYGDEVLRHAYWYLRDEASAHDVAQETFVRLYRNINALRDLGAVRKWLLQTAGNLCKDRIKSWQERNVIAVADPAELPAVAAAVGPETVVLQQEERRRIVAAILRLPVIYREPIVLVYYHQLSTREAAQVLGLREGTLRSRMTRGRVLLAKMLAGEEDLR
mgnify:CR=1 FL=1